jgi:solute carrier family 25 (mitochondrial 2-oxodicarboxylate transporter), member 21
MVKSEGLFSVYKGILPPILAETPKRAAKFLTFEQTKPLFMFGHDKPTPLTFSCAGLAAGVFEAILVNPFEMVKVTLQANRSKTGELPSTVSVAKEIIAKDGIGLKGLNRGLTATIGRNGVFNMIYFGFYHSVKEIVPEYKDSAGKEFLRKVAIGFVSGTLGSVINIPFDVAKSRIQGPQPQPGVVKYKSTFQSIGLVYREEGFRALYKGLTPKVMRQVLYMQKHFLLKVIILCFYRLAPGGAIMMIVYEYVYEYLDKTF